MPDYVDMFVRKEPDCPTCAALNMICPEHLRERLRRHRGLPPTLIPNDGPRVICQWIDHASYMDLTTSMRRALILPEPYSFCAKFAIGDVMIFLDQNARLQAQRQLQQNRLPGYRGKAALAPPTRDPVLRTGVCVRVITSVQRRLVGVLPNYAVLHFRPRNRTGAHEETTPAWRARVHIGPVIMTETRVPVFVYNLHPLDDTGTVAVPRSEDNDE